MVYCKICHKELHVKAEICPDCGVRNTRSIERIPELSIMLSLIIPGLGQSYNGHKNKALLFFNMGMIILFLTIIYRTEFLSMVDKSWILSILDKIEFPSIFDKEDLKLSISRWAYPIFITINIFDAYRDAQKINSEI